MIQFSSGRAAREEKAVIWILAFDIVAAIVAPIGGASVIDTSIR